MLFGNKLFKKKLAPKISPNKTIEGAIVGFIFTWLILFLIFNFLKFNELSSINSTLLLVIVPLVVPIIAIFGDLSFSWIKRIAKIKDFSNVIPGHGGLLDRIDSIALVSFIFLTLFIVV
ncbi:MAG: phosphatidate cytidylyltransferase [Mycoplasma sp.]|nr:phosphatidate cytidylyltransferase [Mycoplasma sp.]